MAKKLRTLAVGVAATVMLAAALPAAASESDVTIAVRVDNRTSVPTDWLQEAEKEASDAYEAIGVSLVWLNSGHMDRPSRGAWFHIVLLPSTRMARAPRGALGFAPLHTNRVYIFGDRIATLAAGRRDFEVILGRLLAHELGHHLLPGQGHSNEGIMQKQVDFRSAKDVGFTDEQRQSIQMLLASN
jgi:hypothetical protein